MKYYQKIFMGLIFVVFFVGCFQRENIKVPKSFIAKPGTLLRLLSFLRLMTRLLKRILSRLKIMTGSMLLVA